jgi:cellulose synthase/poly-beta-1,6-N-acetylglucosamine synthase-like glycosyltransferase
MDSSGLKSLKLILKPICNSVNFHSNKMSSNHPKISVVIPCYNDKDYIQEAVQSVLESSSSSYSSMKIRINLYTMKIE